MQPLNSVLEPVKILVERQERHGPLGIADHPNERGLGEIRVRSDEARHHRGGDHILVRENDDMSPADGIRVATGRRHRAARGDPGRSITPTLLCASLLGLSPAKRHRADHRDSRERRYHRLPEVARG
jgi:hypothetical protein